MALFEELKALVNVSPYPQNEGFCIEGILALTLRSFNCIFDDLEALLVLLGDKEDMN